MPFVQPITITEAITDIDKKKYVLPAIQREFVWSTEQIERLFDSLMRGYPISSFLFWSVKKENIKKYQFYEFIRTYHERDNRHNPKAALHGGADITAVLDGQQRLTSLYIGLRGTYSYKLPRKRWDNDQAFPERKLYLNLLSEPENPDLKYDFQFLTSQEAKASDDEHAWFCVREILDFEDGSSVNDYITGREEIFSMGPAKFKFASKALYRLYEAVHKDRSINLFLEDDESLDKVLNIFIRVNSGGTPLSYSDLLLSIATAQWKEYDARSEITGFVDDINNTGDGFNFDKDFVLKACLVLNDFKDISFKVDNFNKENMEKIEANWGAVREAIQLAVDLVSSFGYSRDTLTSNGALIPIAYYLKKIGSPANFCEANKYLDDRKLIQRWLITAILKRSFSGQPDNILRPTREVIAASRGGFPLPDIIKKLKGSTKSMIFDADEVENIIYYEYGHSYTYSALALLYPTLDFRNKFHQDHIFPKKLFTEKRLLKAGIEGEDVPYFLDHYNCLANLQLLEGAPNREKSGKDFDSWLQEKFPEASEKRDFMRKNYIPKVDLSLENFEKFVEERKKLLSKAFMDLLAQ